MRYSPALCAEWNTSSTETMGQEGTCVARQAILGDKAYGRLREAIVKGGLRPNQRLVEAELSDRFGIGRTPIRHALKMLEDQGLVVKARSSWTVRDLRPEDIRDVYHVRIALGGYAARLTAEAASDDQVVALRRIVSRCGDALLGLSQDDQVSFKSGFHGAIAVACGNPHLATLIERNDQFHFDFYRARLWSKADYESEHAGHHAITEAIIDRDPDAAERLTREHYRSAMEKLLARLI